MVAVLGDEITFQWAFCYVKIHCVLPSVLVDSSYICYFANNVTHVKFRLNTQHHRRFDFIQLPELFKELYVAKTADDVDSVIKSRSFVNRIIHRTRGCDSFDQCKRNNPQRETIL